jgi:hypothetical protein
MMELNSLNESNRTDHATQMSRRTKEPYHRGRGEGDEDLNGTLSVLGVLGGKIFFGSGQMPGWVSSKGATNCRSLISCLSFVSWLERRQPRMTRITRKDQAENITALTIGSIVFHSARKRRSLTSRSLTAENATVAEKDMKL